MTGSAARTDRRWPAIVGRFVIWVLVGAFGGVVWSQIGQEPDSAIEKCLREAEIVGKAVQLEGVTRPRLMQVECDGERRQAVFKTLDVFQRGLTEFSKGGWEVNFSDSYKYERAAYLLDRELGLNMIPVAVIRQIKRTEGALVDWIDASHEHAAPNRPTPQQMAALARQKATMRLFDALIYNVDRNPTNWLVDNADWHLYLIDHSRSFRPLSKLPEVYRHERAWLSRDTYAALQALEPERVGRLVAGLIGQNQLESMMVRRVLLLEKIQADCDEHGESVVIWE